MADRADLLIYQGDDYAAVVTVTQNGTPPEEVIAGYTARAQIREDIADVAPEVVVEISTTVISPLITLGILAADTANMCGDYVWDLEVTAPDGGITTILRGNVRVVQEITREVASAG